MITLIGSLVATGCLYSQLGYTSFVIGSAGIVVGIICFLLSRSCCTRSATSYSRIEKSTEHADNTVDESQRPQSQPRRDPPSGQSSEWQLINDNAFPSPVVGFQNQEEKMDKEAINRDLSQIDQETFNEIFDIQHTINSKAFRRLRMLSLPQIYQVIPFFSTDHWRCLNDAHVKAFDFSKIEESKREVLFGIIFSAYGDTRSNAARRLPQLSSAQLALVRPYLTSDALKYLKG